MGINCFALAWNTPNLRAAYARLEGWGCGMRICDVPDLAAFLSAVLLVPRSITSSFNFPQWTTGGETRDSQTPRCST